VRNEVLHTAKKKNPAYNKTLILYKTSPLVYQPQMYVFIQLSITQQVGCKRYLGDTFRRQDRSIIGPLRKSSNNRNCCTISKEISPFTSKDTF